MPFLRVFPVYVYDSGSVAHSFRVRQVAAEMCVRRRRARGGRGAAIVLWVICPCSELGRLSRCVCVELYVTMHVDLGGGGLLEMDWNLC